MLYGMRFINGARVAGYQYILFNMQEEFGISNLMMATLTSARFFSSLGISLILSGIADRLGNRRLVWLSAGVYLLRNVLSGFSTGPAVTMGAMLVSGAGTNLLNASMFPLLLKIDPKSSNCFSNML